LIFDTETTGLFLHPAAPLEKQPYIVEFAGVRLSSKTGKRLGALSVLIRPPIPIPEEATKIHGISDDDVQNAPTFRAAFVKTIAPALRSCGLLIAHNAPFDLQMLDLEFRRFEDTTTVSKPPSLPRSLCTIGLYRDRYGYDPKLIELYKDVVGREFKQAHRASSDVDALVEIVQKEKLWKL
jgi:DNA polymerase III epsilon subunit-like protein